MKSCMNMCTGSWYVTAYNYAARKSIIKTSIKNSSHCSWAFDNFENKTVNFYLLSLNTEKWHWVWNLCPKILSDIHLKLCEEEKLAFIFNDHWLWINYQDLPIDVFGIYIRDDPSITKKASTISIQFSTSYLYEMRFSLNSSIVTSDFYSFAEEGKTKTQLVLPLEPFIVLFSQFSLWGCETGRNRQQTTYV